MESQRKTLPGSSYEFYGKMQARIKQLEVVTSEVQRTMENQQGKAFSFKKDGYCKEPK